MSTKKELEKYIHVIRPKADCYDRICQSLGITNDVLGYIKKLQDVDSDPPVFQDNRWVRTPPGMRGEYFGVLITSRYIHFYRYTVPGRCDSYDFKWGYSPNDQVARLSYYSEYHDSMSKSLKQLKKDLQKKQIKDLLKKASENVYGKRMIDNIMHLL
jgi:hypothetical protein